MVSISIRPSRHSHQQIMETREFVINLVAHALLQATDFCGEKSGRDDDKYAACSLTPVKMAHDGLCAGRCAIVLCAGPARSGR
jgi:flavin reductase (DIM6/NTAB) family NADH-FMN oxidoreductase RutF